MLRPLLIIGLGGSGGKTIRAIKQVLHQNLEFSGYSGKIPQAWQFLQIDTTYAQGDLGFPAPMLATQEFCSVVPPGSHRDELLSAIENTSSPGELQGFLAGWGIPSLAIQINQSPSMKRADARQVGIPHFASTLKAIEHSVARMHAPNVFVELEEVSKALSLGLPQVEPQVFIFTSIGSPSGSGLLVDIAELLKSTTTASWPREAISFLYTPDVFSSVLGGSSSSIAMNALGTMNELIASRFFGLSEKSKELYSKFGILPRGLESEYGCHTNILVGASNISNDSKNEDMDKIFLKFGTLFGNAILEGEIPNFLEQQIAFVREQSSSATDNSGLTSKKIEIVRFGGWIHENLPPIWSFAPLAESILEQVARSKTNAHEWIQFWGGRRTRPLTEAIPFDSKVRHSIITGWFIADFFGMRKIEFSHEGVGVLIWNPTLQVPDWSEFPSPLLDAGGEETKFRSWILPQLLVSAGIALAEFGKSGNPDSIAGYRLLKYIGREVTTSLGNDDSWDDDEVGDMLPTGLCKKSTFLHDWIRNDSKPSETLELMQPLKGNLETREIRKEALLKAIDETRNHYRSAWKELGDARWQDLPETWELKDDIDLAFASIYQYVEQL